MRLPHVVISHLSVLYTSLLPVLLLASLASSLHSLAGYHQAQPLSTFDIFLPEWAVSTGWSLALLPTSPVIFGAIVYLIWAERGTPRLAVIIRPCQSCLLLNFPAVKCSIIFYFTITANVFNINVETTATVFTAQRILLSSRIIIFIFFFSIDKLRLIWFCITTALVGIIMVNESVTLESTLL